VLPVAAVVQAGIEVLAAAAAAVAPVALAPGLEERHSGRPELWMAAAVVVVAAAAVVVVVVVDASAWEQHTD